MAECFLTTRQGRLRRVEQSLEFVIRAVTVATASPWRGAFGPVRGGHRPEAPPLLVSQVTAEAVVLLRATESLASTKPVAGPRARLAGLVASDAHLEVVSPWSDRSAYRPVDVLATSPEDLHLLACSVLRSSDLGRRATSAQVALRDAESALAIALDIDDPGLVAEVLWLWPMLGLPWRAPAALGLRVLDEAYDAHGFLPGGAYDAAHRDDLASREASHYDLLAAHQATFACGVLNATLLSHPVRVVRRTPAHTVVETAALPGGGTRWEAVYHALGSAERSSLTAFVLSLGVRRASHLGRSHAFVD